VIRRWPRLFDSLVDWPGVIHAKNNVAREFLPAVPILTVPQNGVKKLRLLHYNWKSGETGESDYSVYVAHKAIARFPMATIDKLGGNDNERPCLGIRNLLAQVAKSEVGDSNTKT
jgi:hypothetical protein